MAFCLCGKDGAELLSDSRVEMDLGDGRNDFVACTVSNRLSKRTVDISCTHQLLPTPGLLVALPRQLVQLGDALYKVR
jgi:hypothetical protein